MPEVTSTRSDRLTSKGIMFLCNTTAIKDWSYFLSQILPLVNKSAGFVHQSMDRVEAVTSTMVTALEPDLSGMSASHPPLNSNHTSGMEHVFQYSYSESDLQYTDYRTPQRARYSCPRRCCIWSWPRWWWWPCVRDRGAPGEGSRAWVVWVSAFWKCSVFDQSNNSLTKACIWVFWLIVRNVTANVSVLYIFKGWFPQSKPTHVQVNRLKPL